MWCQRSLWVSRGWRPWAVGALGSSTRTASSAAGKASSRRPLKGLAATSPSFRKKWRRGNTERNKARGSGTYKRQQAHHQRLSRAPRSQFFQDGDDSDGHTQRRHRRGGGLEEEEEAVFDSNGFVTSTRFRKLGIDAPICEALKEGLGAEFATNIQELALPALLQGKDTIVTAETGSGKTLTYMLPFLQRLQRQQLRQQPHLGPGMLVVVPNQELCNQASDVLHDLDPEASTLVVHSTKRPDVAAMRQAHAVFATPHAVAHLMKTSLHAAALQNLHMVVLDEADLLIGGFRTVLEEVLKALHDVAGRENVQHVFLAATMLESTSHNAGVWFNRWFRYAEHIRTNQLHQVNPNVTMNNITIDTMKLYERANEHGIAYAQLLTDARHVALLKALQTVTPNLLDHGSTMPKTLVFTNSADTAEAATAFLHGLLPHRIVEVIHKQVPSDEREELHVEFCNPEGDIDILVATDMVARGLDTVEVAHIVQMELAVDSTSHIHRVGRTGRAGVRGTVTNIVLAEEKYKLQDMLSATSVGEADSVTRARNARHKARRVEREGRERSSLGSF